ncbi:terminase small subunit [Haematobacter sp. UBA3484]|uniref:terminase small subunit n=1 Tax=Haematobacter sp. UBA3484 TaxID=1946582 RepID=UPI0025C70240|nr:terminase small subunit [Haematobacter sp. UBA3484]
MFDLDQTTGTEGGQEQSFQAGALVAPLHIRSICAARERALTLARQAADQLSAAYEVMGEADLSEVITRVEQIIRTQKFEGAAADLLNPNIIARELGLADKTEMSGPEGGAIKTVSEVRVTFVRPDAKDG